MEIFGDAEVRGKHSIIHINLYPTVSKPYSGIVSSDLVGEDITFGNTLYWDFTLKKWKKAKADSTSMMPCEAIALQTVSNGSDCLILLHGSIYCTTWNLTKKNIYVSSTVAGGIVHDQPNASGNIVQLIGTSRSQYVGFFNFYKAYAKII